MTYAESTLVRGETIVYKASLHWMIFVPAVVLMSFLIGIPLLIVDWIAWKTTEMAITNKRVILKSGWITRRTLELNLTKVENVSVEQGIVGRLMNFGTITVVGTGGTRESFNWVVSPLEFRKAVQAASPA